MSDSTAPTAQFSPGYLRYVMLIAFLVLVVSLMDRYVVSILMQQIKLDLSLTDTQLGWLVGPAFVVVHVLCQLPLARLADRTIRRNLISASMFLWSLLTMAAGLAQTFPQLLIARMGVGITEAASSPSLASMLSDYFPPEKRGRAMSMFPLGATAGIGIGMLVGGIVGQQYGWRIALFAAGVPGVLIALLMQLTIREPRRGASEGLAETTAAKEVPVGEVIRTLLASRTFRWMVVGASLSTVAGLGRGTWEPVFLIRVYGMDQATAGLSYFLIGPVPSMLGAFLGGAAADRFGKRDARWYMWLPAVVTLATFPLMAAFLLWPESHRIAGDAIPVGFLFSIAGSVIGGMATPATIATGQSLARPSMRAMTHALWTMASNLIGMGLGPLAAGWISEMLAPEYGNLSIRYSLVIVSSIALPASLALFLAARTIREDLGRAQGDDRAGSTPAPSS